MKYKVGDKVKIREDLVPGTDYDGVHFAYGMTSNMGQILTIKEKCNSQGVDYYKVEECDWSFSDGMIGELVMSLFGFEFPKTKSVPVKDAFGSVIKYIKVEDKDIMKDFKIINYNNYNNKVVVVTFEDGTQEKACCNDADKFDFERGLEVCVMKHIFGADKYKSILKNAMKQTDEIDKAEIAEKQRIELIERKRAKAARKKARRKERERAERIADMKTAYVAALKECGLKHEYSCNCEANWDNLK
jgi:hypothetical protein